MIIKPLHIFIVITILGGFLLFFSYSMQQVMPHLTVDKLLEVESLKDVPNEDLGSIASILRESSSIKTIHISLSLITTLFGIIGIWISSRKK